MTDQNSKPNPLACPLCGHIQVIRVWDGSGYDDGYMSRFDEDDDTIALGFKCSKCGATWDRAYKFVKITDVSDNIIVLRERAKKKRESGEFVVNLCRKDGQVESELTKMSLNNARKNAKSLSRLDGITKAIVYYDDDSVPLSVETVFVDGIEQESSGTEEK